LIRFLLDDGTEIVVKLVLTQVIRTDEKLPDGQCKHEFRMQHIVDQIAPGGDIKHQGLGETGRMNMVRLFALLAALCWSAVAVAQTPNPVTPGYQVCSTGRCRQYSLFISAARPETTRCR